jgi:hypothetical protein
MSELAVRTPEQIALADAARGKMKAVMKTPSLLVPPAVRPALFECWACHRHLTGLDTALPLAALVGTWIGRYGLTEADAADLLQTVQHPDHAAKHKFASDLTSTLAGLVSARLKQRREESATEERTRQAEEAKRLKAELPDGFSLAAMAAGFTSGV